MYGIALIFVLAVMGGAIAFIGDRLGTKVGKKKLSMFGLRPRHTSIIVTIVTGVLITSSTLGVLTLTSRDVRTALFGMKELKATLANLSKEVTVSNSELDKSRRALAEKNAEFAVVDAKIQKTTAKLHAIAAELTDVTAERDRAAAELARARGDLGEARDQIASLETTKGELDKRVTELNHSKAGLERDVANLNELAMKLNKGLKVVREGAIVYRAGEVLATFVLPGGGEPAGVANHLTQILQAVNRGILQHLGVKDEKTEALLVSQSNFEQAVKAVAAAKSDLIVRVSSTDNVVYGEPVIARFDLFENHLIYKEGDVVFQERLEGVKDRAAEEAVLAFLQKVNAAAIQKGILPDPLQGNVGVMSGSQLYEAINKVKKYGGDAMLSAVVLQATNAAGPLRITLQVKPAT